MIHNSLSKVVRFCLGKGSYIIYKNSKVIMYDLRQRPVITLSPAQLKYLIEAVPLVIQDFPDCQLYTLDEIPYSDAIRLVTNQGKVIG